MPNLFDKQRDLVSLEGIGRNRRIAIAAAALDRMRCGYEIWASNSGYKAVDELLNEVWSYVAEGKSTIGQEGLVCIYPANEDSATFESTYAESFLEGLELLSLFAFTDQTMRLVEVRQAAYNMADNAAGDDLLRYGDPDFSHRLTPETDLAMSEHPWVTRELDAQKADLAAAAGPLDFSELIKKLRARAAWQPVVSAGELERIRKFQGG